jgi:hypothetical protein
MIGVNVTFQYEYSFDRAGVIGVADKSRATFEAMPGLRFKFYTLDDSTRRAINFYVWDSKQAALEFFSDELRQRVTDLYGSPAAASTCTPPPGRWTPRATPMSATAASISAPITPPGTTTSSTSVIPSSF